MSDDSRKARLNSFAHHRAHRLADRVSLPESLPVYFAPSGPNYRPRTDTMNLAFVVTNTPLQSTRAH